MNDKKTLFVAGGILLAALAATGYGLFSYQRTVKNIRFAAQTQTEQFAALEAGLEKKNTDLSDRVSVLESKNNHLEDALASAAVRNNTVTTAITQVASSVGDLQKLSMLDPELLKQYSKVYFLNEHYVPTALSTIDPKYIYTPGKKLQFLADAAPFLNSLLAAASANGLSLDLDSAYRSFGTQAVLKQSYIVTYGAGTANSFSAEQGYSEHQLGTAVDFTANSINGTLSGFDKTPEYTWLLNNAYQYGFVISYPQNNASYQFEPWHWRFVGKALALYLHQNNMYFYAADQRKIDTYLGNIFDT